jgi:flavin reductase (DIM6/NTAB) family NADH-FMN oxidoreductase RutF
MDPGSAAPQSVYFYYPRLVGIVGVRDDERTRTNFAPVTWTSPLSSDPPFYGICLTPATHTHHLVLATGEFTINLLPYERRQLAQDLGRLSGREVDKVKELGLALMPGVALTTPTLADAYFAAECSVVDRHHLGDQTLIVGEILRTRFHPDVFDQSGVLRIDAIKPLLYLGGNRYLTSDPASLALASCDCCDGLVGRDS